jgi:heme-degrading monooxygenase HmoA
MIARIHQSELHREKAEAAKSLWEGSIIPAMKKHKGFKNIYVLTNAKSGKVTTISIWESESAATEWANCEDFRKYSGKLKDHVKKIPSMEVFDVSIAG